MGRPIIADHNLSAVCTARALSDLLPDAVQPVLAGRRSGQVRQSGQAQHAQQAQQAFDPGMYQSPHNNPAYGPEVRIMCQFVTLQVC